MSYVSYIERQEKIFFQNMLVDLDIPYFEGIVLLVIGRDLFNQDTISVLSGLDKYRIAKIAAQLEEKGLVYRETNNHNKREKLVRLTSEGNKLYIELNRVVFLWDEICYSGIEKEEITQFKNVADKIMFNIEKYKLKE